MAKIVDVIKYEGDNSTFIWKHPCEDFNSLTQLIVHESQEAIFFMNGEALDLFGPGRHTLETQNIPKIGKKINRLTDNETPFHCEVYFINKAVHMALKWGTDTKIRFLDPNFGIPLEIGACGEMNLEVSDSRKLLLKLVGVARGIAWEERGPAFTKSIQNCFRPLISTAVKSHLPAAIKENNINLLEIDEQLEALSATLRECIVGGFEEYGLTIPQFYVTNVALPETDRNFQEIKKLHTLSLQTKMIEAEAKLTASRRRIVTEQQITETEIAKHTAERRIISAQAEAQAEAEVIKATGFAEAEVMAAKGYTQKDAFAAEVQKEFGKGLGTATAGGVGGDMLGLGIGVAAAGTVAPQFSEMMKGMTPAAAESKCAKCGAALPANAKFCLECGEKVTSADTVTCPQCGKDVAKGKVCPECGYKFVTVCPVCGADVPAGAKFCPECGEKL